MSLSFKDQSFLTPLIQNRGLLSDPEEQRKIERIKTILSTSIRSIQRNSNNKARERKNILVTDRFKIRSRTMERETTPAYDKSNRRSSRF